MLFREGNYGSLTLLLLSKHITYLFRLEELNKKLLSIWIRMKENLTRLPFLSLKIT